MKRTWTLALVLACGCGWMLSTAYSAERPTRGEGTAVGTIVEKGESAIRLKADNGQAETYRPMWRGGSFDKAMLAQFAALKIGDRVELRWVMAEGRRVVELHVIQAVAASSPTATKPAVTAPPPGPVTGTLVGQLTEKSKEWIRLKNDSASERFTARWIGGQPEQGGGFDKQTLSAIEKLNVGDRVEVKWEMLEGKRITSLRVLEAATSRPAKESTTQASAA